MIVEEMMNKLEELVVGLRRWEEGANDCSENSRTVSRLSCLKIKDEFLNIKSFF